MSTSTRVLCLLPALWPAITLGEPSKPAGQSCPAPSGKSTVPAQMASIPPGEKTLSLILEARDDDGQPISDQKEVMEWVRLRLALAGTQPDGTTILPEGSHSVRVQLRGETVQQARDLELYLCCHAPFWILPVHPDNDALPADRYPATGIIQQTNPGDKLASESIVQADIEQKNAEAQRLVMKERCLMEDDRFRYPAFRYPATGTMQSMPGNALGSGLVNCHHG